MDGLLIIDKPAGLTSHDVVARVRRILKTKRVGHTGTLDPFATGVMVILIGKATRLARFLDKDVKEYEAEVRFGYETNTGDRTGERRDTGTSEREGAVTVAEIEQILPDFRGEIEQIPPMYSAKKIDGKKLYELARKGVEIERKPIEVLIHELEVLNSEEICSQISAIRIRVVCSAGTYIRTLAEDIGRRMGRRAHLAELRRIRAGRFDLSQAITIEEMQSIDDPEKILIPVNEAVESLPKIVLKEERVQKTKNGLSTRYDGEKLENEQAIQMVDEHENLIAIGFFNEAEKIVQPKVVLG